MDCRPARFIQERERPYPSHGQPGRERRLVQPLPRSYPSTRSLSQHGRNLPLSASPGLHCQPADHPLPTSRILGMGAMESPPRLGGSPPWMRLEHTHHQAAASPGQPGQSGYHAQAETRPPRSRPGQRLTQRG